MPEYVGCDNPIMFYVDEPEGQPRVYGFDRGDIPVVDIGPHGQSMLTVKDDWEDHEAAIRNLKKELLVADLHRTRERVCAEIFRPPGTL